MKFLKFKSRLRPPAFTLIELLVAIAIIAILAAMLMPALGFDDMIVRTWGTTANPPVFWF